MENFAHIYLAFNQDCDRANDSVAPTPSPIPSSWAAPITPPPTFTSSASPQEASTIQEADADFDTYAYPSFYL